MKCAAVIGRIKSTKYGVDDVERFIRANKSQFANERSDIIDCGHYANKLAANSEIIFALEGDEPIGMIACYNNDARSRIAFISYFCVAKSHHRLGVGRALLRASIKLSLEREMREIALEVSPGNHAALALYYSEGFEVQSARSGPHNMGSTILAKPLTIS